MYGTEEIQEATKSKTRSRRNRIEVHSAEASSVEKGIGQKEEGALASNESDNKGGSDKGCEAPDAERAITRSSADPIDASGR